MAYESGSVDLTAMIDKPCPAMIVVIVTKSLIEVHWSAMPL